MGEHPANGELLYKLIERQCTLDAIQELLREFKPLSKDIKVTAENKHDVITKNMRRAVDARLIPINRVFDLLRDSEENGAQHIFFYQPRNSSAAAHCANADGIAQSLWGRDWEKTQKFPHLVTDAPTRPKWCDFRSSTRRVVVPGIGNGSDGKTPREYTSWTAKMYGSAVRYESLGAEEAIGVDPRDGATIYQRRYKRIIERTVMLMRWTSLGLLEIRVPTWSSRHAVEEMRDLMIAGMRDALDIRDFPSWILNTCCTKMVREFAANRTLYDFSDTRVRDSGQGTVTFSTLDEEETLFDVVERQKALEILLKPKKNRCERLILKFLKQKQTEALPSDLRVVVGAHEPNEIVIGAATTPAAVDYVIYRLRDFA
jgi:hypothetical protein